MKKRRSFSREFKREAAGMVLDQGFSYREVCRQLDLGETGLRRWVEQFSSSAMVVFQNQKR
jgi:transposase